jgi:Ca-activated chloride channel homolog
MRQSLIVGCLTAFTLVVSPCCMESQTSAAVAQTQPPYSLRVPVDEVDLTFHAADNLDLAVDDLSLGELTLLDNGVRPSGIIDFRLMKDSPIRAGILIDTSASMREHIAVIRTIATDYAEKVLRQQTDQAFVMDFGRQPTIVQPWTSDPRALSLSLRRMSTFGGVHLGGTAIFDAIYRACHDQFRQIDHASTGNFILLFSDGDDNASQVSLNAAVAECQRTNTAVFAFRAESNPGFSDPGPATLAGLTSQTGGSIFRDNDSDAGIYQNLSIIEDDLRDQYRLVYKSPNLKHDGSFHRINLIGPDRAARITVRSGYYAPIH